MASSQSNPRNQNPSIRNLSAPPKPLNPPASRQPFRAWGTPLHHESTHDKCRKNQRIDRLYISNDINTYIY